jgi:predicted phosphodiesterase
MAGKMKAGKGESVVTRGSVRAFSVFALLSFGLAAAPPAGEGTFRIAVLGDTHSTDGVHARIVADMRAAAPDLVLHTGDVSLKPGENGGAAEFFRVEAPLLKSVPIVAARGNHDGSVSRFVDTFVRPRGAGDTSWYIARFGNVAVVVLDTNESVSASGPQGLWLERTLAALAAEPDVAFRFVVMHWGPFDSGSGHGSNLDVRTELVPLFERYGVDIVFSGHDHIFERSTIHGVRYVVTGGGGGGGGKYGRKRHVPMGASFTEASAAVPHFCLLEVAGRALRFTAREAETGRLLDEFRIETRR